MRQINWQDMPEREERISIEQFRLNNYIFYKGELSRIVSLDYDLDDESVPLIGVEILPNEMRGKSDTVLEEHWTGSWTYVRLSDEVLDKFGFVNDDIAISKNIVWLSPSGNGYYSVFVGSLSKIMPFKIQYLHELQNLYYALTTQELKIKL